MADARKEKAGNKTPYIPRAAARVRLPKKVQEAEEEVARRADEEAGLTPLEVEEAAAVRADAVEEAVKRMQDEAEVFPDPEEVPLEDIVKWRDDAEDADILLAQPKEDREEEDERR